MTSKLFRVLLYVLLMLVAVEIDRSLFRAPCYSLPTITLPVPRTDAPIPYKQLVPKFDPRYRDI